MSAARLSVAIVTFQPALEVFGRALASLAGSVRRARACGLLAEARVFVIDNGPADARGELRSALESWGDDAGELRLVEGHGNIGYGRANNLVLGDLASDFHLVMNPDVELEPQALAAALDAMAAHPEVGLVAPAAYGVDGERQYLCKRYPSAWVLFLRGFAPEVLQKRYARVLADYEMRDVIGDRFVKGIPLASGCFMLVRTAIFRRLGGFDPRYFMYFEDYDLSLRVGRESDLAYVPGARVIHHGGEASRKGWRHVAWFARSAWRFFAAHGWRIA